MPKRKISISDSFKSFKSDLASSGNISKIPSIIEFCESQDFLGLDGINGNVKLFPVQELVLKTFYRGSVGNENLSFTEKDMELCRECGFVNDENGNIPEKWSNGEIFGELVLAWGRRGGKDFVISIIALYEACKLLLVPGGDPYRYYHCAASSPITIVTVANSQDQASIAFFEMHEKIRNSKFFADKIGPEGITADQIWFCTPKDREDNKILSEKGHPVKKGSILLQIGHSNSAGLLGKGIFVAIFDEVASYKQTGGNSSGDQMYRSVGPAVKTYVRYAPLYDSSRNKLPITDAFGEIVKDKTTNMPMYQEDRKNPIYDGKILSISSPRGKDGKFWELYSSSPSVPFRLMFRAPTWVANPLQTKDGLRKYSPDMTEEEFAMEYGAEFSGTAGESFFPRDKVESAFKPNCELVERGKPGYIYYAHLDPARTSHNYGLAIVHRENFINAKKENDFCIIVDHIKYWHPTPGNPIKTEDVDEYIIGLRYKFHLGMVSYDIWNSNSSIEKLKRKGIPSRQVHFTSTYQMKIYALLYDLIVSDRIKIPIHKLLRDEMINLQRKYTQKGFRVCARSDGDCRTDDIVDSLAGAVYSCLSTEMQRLPSGKLVNTGFIPSSNSRQWMGMQGPIGYGTGQQISSGRERIDSWPNSLRR